jgi:hypothetical protein
MAHQAARSVALAPGLEPPLRLAADGHFQHDATGTATLDGIACGGDRAHSDTTNEHHPVLDHCTHSHVTTVATPPAVADRSARAEVARLLDGKRAMTRFSFDRLSYVGAGSSTKSRHCSRSRASTTGAKSG